LIIALGRLQYSLVDCIGYIIMHKNQIEKAFSFKRSYAEQGFVLLAEPSGVLQVKATGGKLEKTMARNNFDSQ
jgi:hypothetical protein